MPQSRWRISGGRKWHGRRGVTCHTGIPYSVHVLRPVTAAAAQFESCVGLACILILERAKLEEGKKKANSA
jgi:hypothetical protein